MLFVILLACLAVVMVVECQLHVVSVEHTHTANAGQHRGSATPSIDFHCMIAILPTVMFFTLALFFMFRPIPLCLTHSLHSFPFFIPPRLLSR
jgi:hypothetical protein